MAEVVITLPQFFSRSRLKRKARGFGEATLGVYRLLRMD
jgi:hypothetical protein